MTDTIIDIIIIIVNIILVICLVQISKMIYQDRKEIKKIIENNH